jgi:four helix bundle protein
MPEFDNTRGHFRLIVWQKSMDLVVRVYSAAARLPAFETHGLGSQLRRASVSIPSNIAEGYGRSSLRDYLRHLAIANGSLLELETQITVAGRVGYLDETEVTKLLRLAAEVGRMLAGMMSGLRRKAMNAEP